MGANVWRDEHEWPLARTQWTSYFLHGGGDRRLSTQPLADEPPDSFTYDPTDPAPGPLALGPTFDDAVDLDTVAARPDVLVYVTEPLADDVEITGPVTLELWASTSAPSTDFTAKVIEVFPDGRTIHLCQGVVRTGAATDDRGYPAPSTATRSTSRRRASSSRRAAVFDSTCPPASSPPSSRTPTPAVASPTMPTPRQRPSTSSTTRSTPLA